MPAERIWPSIYGILVASLCALVIAWLVQPPHATATPQGDAAKNGEEEDEDDRPDWVTELPESPGERFYATGHAPFQDEVMMRMAVQQAEADARMQLAERAVTLLRSELRDYLSELKEADPDRDGLAEFIEQLSQPVMMVDFRLDSYMVLERHTEEQPDINIVHVLVASPMDKLYETLKERSERKLTEAEIALEDEERAAFEKSLAETLGLEDEDDDEEDEEDEEDDDE